MANQQDVFGRDPFSEDELDSIWRPPENVLQPKKSEEKEFVLPEPLPVIQASSPAVSQNSDPGEIIRFDRNPQEEKISEDEEKERRELEETHQLVGFNLEDEFFGVDILNIQEIIRVQDITPVPNTAHFVVGVLNLRGRVIPIIQLRTRFGFSPKAIDKFTRIIVVNMDAGTIGFMVDSVSEVIRIPKSIVEPPPAIVSGIESECITGVGRLADRLLIILELNRVITVKEKIFA